MATDEKITTTDYSVPFYLREIPNDYNPTSVGTVNIFDTSMLDAPSTAHETSIEGVWNSLADAAGSAASSTKNALVGAWDATTGAMGSALTGLDNIAESFINTTLMYVLLGVAVLVGAIWVIGKSGIIGQAAPLAGAFV